MNTAPFSEIISDLGIDHLSEKSRAMSSRDVERALGASELKLSDLAALISPAAGDDFLEPVCRRAHELTIRRFGRTIHMFAPLYVSNECVSTCTYCGFAKNNDVVRTTLDTEAALVEARHLTAQGIRHVLIVSGEHARIISVDYLVAIIETLAPEVPQISLEVQTWDVADYERLVEAGADGIVVYQETYDPARYAEVHLHGRKVNYEKRLDALDRAATAGARRLGVGALLGLSSNWRSEVLSLAAHARWLMHKHWRCEVAVALPRLRPCAGGVGSFSSIADRDFVLAISALRLYLPDAAIVMTTRESPELRDPMMQIGVTHISAGSRTEPGGYVHEELEAEPQFEVEDRRPIGRVAEAVAMAGYEPVWKDWARV